MELLQLSREQFNELVRGIVDDRLRELLGDPDLGLQLSDDLRARLKESLSSKERLSGDDIANQLGLRW
jgi:CRP-like cAMP-binding protein